MTNITCLHCGAENPLQSKFCNRCGASFSTDTTHICPECSTPNPINLLYCDNCGTRLVDDTVSSTESEAEEDGNDKRSGRSEPFSLPERPPGQTGNLDVSAVLPDWLKTGDFSADPGETSDDDLPWLRAAQEDRDWNDEGAPTLEELSADHAPRDDLPTWLLDEEIAGVIFSGEKSTDELFMASLGDSDELSEDELTERQADPEETAAELQHWLDDLENEEPDNLGGDESASMSGETHDLSYSAISEMPEDDFLQWLSEIQQHAAESEGGDAPEETEELSSLSELPSDVALDLDSIEEQLDIPITDEEDESDAPTWLVGAQEDVPLADATQTFEADADAAPNWLMEPVSDEHRELEDFAKQYEPLAQEQEDEDPTPLWATDSTPADNAPDTASEGPSDSQDDEFLQWLDSLGMEGEPIKGEREHIPQGEHQPSLSSEPEDFDSFASEDDFRLPDWLGGLSDPDASAEISDGPDIDALPDWLQDLSPPGDEFALPYVTGSATEIEEQEADEAPSPTAASPLEPSQAEKPAAASDLPDWIAAVTAELDDLEDAPQQAVEPDYSRALDDAWQVGQPEEGRYTNESMALSDEEVSGDDLPDWFSDIMADIKVEDSEPLQGTVADLPDVPQQLAGADLPDWLDSPYMDEEAAEPTPLEEIPEWLRAPLKERLARAAEERGLSEPALESGEEWRELLEAPLTNEEMAEHGGQDAVPVWLESLRASAREGEGKTEYATESDADSPIAGIEGAIGIAPVVARAARREPVVSTGASSKEQEQQILLLRQMARLQHEEMNIMAPAVTGSQPLPTLTRVLLALLLLGLIAVGIQAGDLLSELAPEASRSELAANIQELVDASAGQPTLIVFNYTPSMAGALDPVANSLLQNLSERGSTVLVTSQSAAGLALAHRATAASAAASQSLGFIPGEALGVRRLGSCLAQEAPCATLFGQDVTSESLALLAVASRVVVFAADRDSLITWIEQLNSTGMLSLNAVVTPALEPVALPYLASGQLDTVTIADGTMTAGTGATIEGNIAALNLAHWFVIATLFIGAAYYLLVGLIRRRSS